MTNSESLPRYNISTGQEVSKVSATYDLYLDVLFVINFIMDYLVLSITASGFSYGSLRRQRVLAAGFGALWAAVAAVFPGMPSWIEIPVTFLAVPGLMVWIAFGVKEPKEIIKAAAGLYAVTAVTAGGMEALYRHTAAGWYLEQLLLGEKTAAMPLGILFLLAAGTYFGLRGVMARLRVFWEERSHFYEVTIHYRGKEKKITAFLDSGNRLFEPISRRPVHVVTYEAVKGVCSGVSRVIYIPYGSVGKEQGVLPGIFLDKMEIRQGSRVKVVEEPLVAVVKQPLSQDGRYQMLLHEI